MSCNIINYLENQQLSFSELPLNEVDSLVFSSLAYIDFEHAKPFTRMCKLDLFPAHSNLVKLHDILCLCPQNEIITNSWLADSDKTADFLNALMACRRYRDVKLMCYKHESSPKIEKQFCAITFLENSFAYIAFRGTDGTFSGWKEDFNLAYMPIIPSQRTALNYLSGIKDALQLPLYVGGHSKGGNLAEYAALCVDELTNARIKGVFNHDGPSFLETPNSNRFKSEPFQKKSHKTVPESSIIGMILEQEEDYRIVQSDSHSVFQHHPFSWLVNSENWNEFATQTSINKSAQFFDSALDKWLRSVDDKTRAQFINTLYSVLNSAGCDRFSDFQEHIPSNVATIVKSSAELDKDTRKFILKLLGDFVNILVVQR